MHLFEITGGRPLRGVTTVNGSKNAALPIMASALAMQGSATLHEIPALTDVRTMIRLLRSVGADVTESPGALSINADQVQKATAAYDLVRRMRASVCVLGPLLARYGYARVALPGGCHIGHRPIDLHLRGMSALGAVIRVQEGYVIAEAKRLRGADISLGGPQGSTVTGTCNVMVAAALASGRTIIRSAACEPEVCDLGRFLNAGGAKIEGLGSPLLEIDGVEQLTGVRHTVIPDRIEAATLAVAAAITGGEILIRNAPVGDLASVIAALSRIGVLIRPEAAGLRVSGTRPMSSVDLVALPYPGLPTDTQAQLTALLSLVPGTSMVTDRVFPDRFRHAGELIRMGADIRVNSGTAIIRGVSRLTGASVMASDLRASAALVLASLAAEGTSRIRRVYHLDRGYAAFEEKLNALGADIQRIPDSDDWIPDDHSADTPDRPVATDRPVHSSNCLQAAGTVNTPFENRHRDEQTGGQSREDGMCQVRSAAESSESPPLADTSACTYPAAAQSGENHGRPIPAPHCRALRDVEHTR